MRTCRAGMCLRLGGDDSPGSSTVEAEQRHLEVDTLRRLLILIALASLVAAACGDDTPAVTTAPTETTAPAETTAPTETTAAPTTTAPGEATTTDAAALFDLDALTEGQRERYLGICERVAEEGFGADLEYTMISHGEYPAFDPTQDQSDVWIVVPQALIDGVLAIDLGIYDEGFHDAVRAAVLPHCP